MRQRILSKNLGKDTHVRNFQGNVFRKQASETYQMVAGEILFAQPEPLYRQTMVTVELARGGKVGSVAYPGAFVDPITGNIHGTYEGPIPGQMVMLGFENGNVNSPFVVNRYPYQGRGNTNVEAQYINPLTKALFDASDVITGHFSGSYLAFYTGGFSGQKPASVTLKAVSDFNAISGANILLDTLLTAEVKSAIVKLTGSTQIELNGNTNWAIKYTEMKAAFDQIKTDLNNFITAYNSHMNGAYGLASAPAVASAADMSGAKNTKVLM